MGGRLEGEGSSLSEDILGSDSAEDGVFVCLL